MVMGNDEPNRIGDGIDKHVRRSVLYFMMAMVVGICVIAGVMHFYPFLNPKDPALLPRQILGRVVWVIGGCTALCGNILFLDWISNGNLVRQILRSPIACALFAGAMGFAVAWIFCG